jgi:uncharacterized protein DUF4058
MDPWLEHPDGWQGVHTRLITKSSDFLQPQLRQLGYFVEIEERIYIEASERHVVPDLAIIQTRQSVPKVGKHAVLEADEPVLVRSFPESEIHERYLQIFAVAGRRLVTQIEVISHTNKKWKRGRELYVQKRDELLHGNVNIVEIDLLRGGPSIIDLDERTLDGLKPWDYLANVVRQGQLEHEVYRVTLRDRLPRVRIPLRPESSDAVLDLQHAFDQVYDSGPYPDRLDYSSPPVPPLSTKDDAWADQLLRFAGLRTNP